LTTLDGIEVVWNQAALDQPSEQEYSGTRKRTKAQKKLDWERGLQEDTPQRAEKEKVQRRLDEKYKAMRGSGQLGFVKP
jgi:hypothetical protein